MPDQPDKTTKIWVVHGTTGEYSDRWEWVVCAFADEQKAKDFAEAATRRAKEIAVSRDSQYRVPLGTSEYDPRMQMDYTGTDYFISETELRE